MISDIKFIVVCVLAIIFFVFVFGRMAFDFYKMKMDDEFIPHMWQNPIPYVLMAAMLGTFLAVIMCECRCGLFVLPYE